jgi:hypothetical protein
MRFVATKNADQLDLLALHRARERLVGRAMKARSTTRSKQKPDTLMQDRASARSTKPSCNARPDHTYGQKRESRSDSLMTAFPAAKMPPHWLWAS